MVRLAIPFDPITWSETRINPITWSETRTVQPGTIIVKTDDNAHVKAYCLARRSAIVRLWNEAIRDVDIRHPNSLTKIEIFVWPSAGLGWTDDRVRVDIEMYNLADTEDLDTAFSQRFVHSGSPEYWPGYELAKAYICGLWASYMVHESMELVTFKGNRVLDPHKSFACLRWLEDLGLSVCLELVSPGESERALRTDRAIAARQVINEMNPWIPGA